MKKSILSKFGTLFSLIVLTSSLTACSCSSSTEVDVKEKIVNSQIINVVSETEGETFDTINNAVKGFAKQYFFSTQAPYGSENARSVYGTAREKENYAPIPVCIQWDIDGDDYQNCLVKASTDMYLKNSVQVNTKQKTAKLYNLESGKTYFYQLRAEFEDRIEVTSRSYFKTAPSETYYKGIRPVYIDGVQNARDVGGIRIGSGEGEILAGKIYRSASLDKISETGKFTFINDLGIKTDLDLRSKSETGNREISPVGEAVKFINKEGVSYFDNLKDTRNLGKLKECLMVFTESDNYPICVHDSNGRDKTGTIMFILEGLLGVSENYCFRDYELSFLTESGYDRQHDYQYYADSIMVLYNEIMTCDGSNFSEKINDFVVSKVGLSKKDVGKIKTALIGD